MNTVIARTWVEALRSGEYAQTTNALHTAAGFCCLGVLCDLYRKEHAEARWVGPMDEGQSIAFSPKDTAPMDVGILPQAVKLWADMKTLDGSLPEGNGESIVRVESGYGPTSRPAETLAELNDDGKRTFAQIADIIERFVEQL